jgi:hypothetical protein
VFVLRSNVLLSAGRDKVINAWCLRTYKHLRTIPTYEGVEALSVLPPHALTSLLPAAVSGLAGRVLLATGGEQGRIRVWSFRAKTDTQSLALECVHTQPLPQPRLAAAASSASSASDSASDEKKEANLPTTDTVGINYMFVATASDPSSASATASAAASSSAAAPAGGDGQLIAVTSDHNFYLCNLSRLQKEKLLIGWCRCALLLKTEGKGSDRLRRPYVIDCCVFCGGDRF